MRPSDEDRVRTLLEDIRLLVADGLRIVRRGQDVFLDADDRTQRLAAKAIVIDLQTAAQRLPTTFRDAHPDVPWDEIRAMHNYLAHDCENSDFTIVWTALAVDFPTVAAQLGLESDERG